MTHPTREQLEQGEYRGDLGGVTKEPDPKLVARMAMSKAVVELPVKRAIDPAIVKHELARGEVVVVNGVGPGANVTLAADSLLNETKRRRKVHRLLLLQPLRLPADLALPVYEDILEVEISDPYLGLAPKVLGGEGGRVETP